MISTLKNHLVNIPGWRTNRKIVVFESDDWGMIRMASKASFEKLLKKGYSIDKCPYNRNDSLENNEDLTHLAEVLYGIRDHNRNPAIFTMNNIVANPDFEKIKDSRFTQYFYEPFLETLNRRNDSDNVLNLYREGISKGIFKMQFHGREHIQVNNWLKFLRDGNTSFIDFFNLGMSAPFINQNSPCKSLALDGMATYNDIDFKFVKESISTGMNLFESIWGFKSLSVIAPCYTWHTALEEEFHLNGIKYIQGGRAQNNPNKFSEKHTIIRRYIGQRNIYKQTYLMRNVVFEPAENTNIDWVDISLKQISNAFLWKKPAIISTHRLNYIGSINLNNREKNCNLLKKLLFEIKRKWPEIEFMSSDKLGELIEK
jgi:hypothetical protein